LLAAVVDGEDADNTVQRINQQNKSLKASARKEEDSGMVNPPTECLMRCLML